MNAKNVDEEPEDFLEDTYAEDAEHVLLPPKQFEAWHHPRKQYVRIMQWCSAVQKLIPRLNLGEGKSFRYLTLPGNELFDVRALHGVVEGKSVKLQYLGFNSVGRDTRAQAELAISKDEVQTLKWIDGASSVIEDRLEDIAVVRSLAARRAEEMGPFHAINLDLCDSIAFREVGHAKGSILGAIGKLLNLQLQFTDPWLLFITTKAEPDLVGKIAREGFESAIMSNVAVSNDFRLKLASLLAGGLGELQAEIDDAWRNQDVRFLRLFCTGLGKWLLKLLAETKPQRRLTLLSSCYYQSGPTGPDMLSLAFLCETAAQPVVDPFKILPEAELSPPFSEIESALALADQVAALFDLDAHLQENAPLREKLIKQAGRLLATARFVQAEYEDWARVKFVNTAAEKATP